MQTLLLRKTATLKVRERRCALAGAGASPLILLASPILFSALRASPVPLQASPMLFPCIFLCIFPCIFHYIFPCIFLVFSLVFPIVFPCIFLYVPRKKYFKAAPRLLACTNRYIICYYIHLERYHPCLAQKPHC